ATRKLFDLGSSTQRSPSLAKLATPTVLRIHPHDFDRLGVEVGAPVTVTSARGAVTLPVEPDAGVARGTAAAHFNQPGPDIGALIDSAGAVTEVRVERS
ncbi:MAG TPA: molybdopterin dinucleotide binding domain-containing protein, partial [Acidimicrobiales bacterium]